MEQGVKENLLQNVAKCHGRRKVAEKGGTTCLQGGEEVLHAFILAPPLGGCVMGSQQLYLSVPWFPCLCQGLLGFTRANTHRHLGSVLHTVRGQSVLAILQDRVAHLQGNPASQRRDWSPIPSKAL